MKRFLIILAFMIPFQANANTITYQGIEYNAYYFIKGILAAANTFVGSDPTSVPTPSQKRINTNGAIHLNEELNLGLTASQVTSDNPFDEFVASINPNSSQRQTIFNYADHSTVSYSSWNEVMTITIDGTTITANDSTDAYLLTRAQLDDYIEDRVEWGFAYGYIDGFEEGYNEGYKDGYDDGFQDGWDAHAAAVNALLP